MTDDFDFSGVAGIERELADRLARVARAFVAELRAEGRLVEPGSAGRGEGGRLDRPPERVVRLTPRQGPAHFQRVGSEADLRASASEVRLVSDAVSPGMSDVPDQEVAAVSELASPLMSGGRDAVFVPDPAVPSVQVPSEVPDFAAVPEPAVPVMSPALAAEAPPDPAARLEPVPTPPAGMLRGAITLPHTRRHAPTAPPEDPAPVPRPLPERPTPADEDVQLAVPETEPGEGTAGPMLLAGRLRVESAGRLEVTQITADAERVGVHIHALGLADWEYWLAVIGVPPDVRTLRVGDTEVVTGRIEGTEVRLTAHEVPRLLDEASRTLVTPYRLGGRVYDLARSLTDRHGRSWRYLGRDGEDGTPLLALSGTDGPPMPLGTLVATRGPLT
ncbi:BN159_2729 family protein [Streptomyces sp. DSM 110735]|uniref:BN159_2729 family protein n=1 Tax=Streptomyces sp. DSM 110735 TaxID=2775031 RepID=UPI0018F371D8|nr:BN159_2729 family protein [Streptomyces sp. DSM 110735]MBJ7907272.1 BN159_2729 family protein [Streptomyces sp. DSM 110735]